MNKILIDLSKLIKWSSNILAHFFSLTCLENKALLGKYVFYEYYCDIMLIRRFIYCFVFMAWCVHQVIVIVYKCKEFEL
jgi:hypothetical protein